MIYNHIQEYDHIISFVVFVALGLKVIKEALSDEEKKCLFSLSFMYLLSIGVATSIDALVAGVSLYILKVHVLLAAFVIGIVTFINSIVGFYLSAVFSKFPTKYVEILAGIILIGLGIKALF